MPRRQGDDDEEVDEEDEDDEEEGQVLDLPQGWAQRSHLRGNLIMMKLVAEGDKIILKREEVFSKSWEAIKKLGLVMPDAPEHKDLTKVNPNPTVFGRIVSIGPEYKGHVLPVDPIESALAGALTAASTAGRTDVVAQLAAELQARRTSRETRDAAAPSTEPPTPLKLGDLVVFGTAAQVKFRDGSEFVITTPGGILARVENDEKITPASLGPRAGAGNGTTEAGGEKVEGGASNPTVEAPS